MYPRGFQIARMRADEVAQQYTGNVAATEAGLAEGGPDQPPAKPARSAAATEAPPASSGADDEIEDVGGETPPERRDSTPPPPDEEEPELDEEGKPKPKVEPPVETEEEETDEDVDISGAPKKETSSYVKKAKEKYPNLFKEFPDLREAYFSVNKYRELFPTIEDARDASGQSELYQVMAGRILEGHSDQLIDSLVQEGRIEDFAKSFLPTLMEKQPKVYVGITTEIMRRTLEEVAKEGTAVGNDNIRKAVRWVSQIIFGTPEVPGAARPDPKIQQEKTQLQKEKEEFLRTKERTFDDRVKGEINKKLMDTAIKGLDPQKKLSDFNRRALVKAILQEVGAAGAADTSFMRQMQSLWKRAAQAGFTGEWEARIVSAYLARATNLLEPIRQREKKALGYGKPPAPPAEGGEPETPENREEEREEQNPPPRRAASRAPAPAATVANRGEIPNDPKKIDWKRTSDEDFLHGRVQLRRRG